MDFELKLLIKAKISDIIFRGHLKRTFTLDIIYIALQIVFLMLTLVSGVLEWHLDTAFMFCSILLCIMTVILNVVSSSVWKKQLEEVNTFFNSEIFK